jgi:hypothetical protein
MQTSAESEEPIYRWRAAIKEAHRQRWERKGGAFYRTGVVLSLFGFATVGVIAILFLVQAL